MAKLSDFGANPNASRNVNADNGWGPYKWPQGVPSNLLGVAEYKGVKSTVRKELVPIFEAAYKIAEKHNYKINVRNPNGNGEFWGPFGYENRAIAGTSSASNHSRGRANDWNAPWNPYNKNNFTTDFPVAMVRDLEAIGLGWGGRYGDTMHWEYAWTPGDVAGHLAVADRILKGATGTTPSTEELTVGQYENIMAAIAGLAKKIDDLPVRIWVAPITGDVPGGHANELLAAAAVNSGIAATAITAETAEIDRKLLELPTAIWIKSITDKGANELLTELVSNTEQILSDMAADDAAPPTSVPATSAGTYTVQPGDTLSSIAKATGTTVDAIVALNKLLDPGYIEAGQKLEIPAKTA